MLDLEIIESNDQFIKVMKYVASKCPQNEIVESDGVVITWSNIENMMCNTIFMSNPVRDEADLEARIKVVCDYTKNCELPWMLLVSEDFLPEEIRTDATKIFSRHELGLVMNLNGMAANKLLPPKKATPELECRLVETIEMRRAFADINALSYNMRNEQFRDLLEIEEYWEKVFGTLGYVEGKPVSAALTINSGDGLYLGLVATLSEYRSQGYAQKVVWHSVTTAQQNCGRNRSVLHATQQGDSVYRKLGYYPVSSFSIYTSNSK